MAEKQDAKKRNQKNLEVLELLNEKKIEETNK